MEMISAIYWCSKYTVNRVVMVASVCHYFVEDHSDVAQGVAFLTNFRIICNHNKNIQYPACKYLQFIYHDIR